MATFDFSARKVAEGDTLFFSPASTPHFRAGYEVTHGWLVNKLGEMFSVLVVDPLTMPDTVIFLDGPLRMGAVTVALHDLIEARMLSTKLGRNRG